MWVSLKVLWETGEVAEMAECLPSLLEDSDSISSTTSNQHLGAETEGSEVYDDPQLHMEFKCRPGCMNLVNKL